MTQINIIANKIISMDSNYNQGTGISGTFYWKNSTGGSQIMTFINGLLCQPLTSGSGNGGGEEPLIFDFINGTQGWVLTTSGCSVGSWSGNDGGYLDAEAFNSSLSGGYSEWDYYAQQTHTITSVSLVEFDWEDITDNLRFTDSYSFPSGYYGKTIDYLRFLANSGNSYLADVAIFFTDNTHWTIINTTGTPQPFHDKLYYLRIINLS